MTIGPGVATPGYCGEYGLFLLGEVRQLIGHK